MQPPARRGEEEEDDGDGSPPPYTMSPEGTTRGRDTPTHPPYAQMIAAAIESLAEEGGSKEEAISEYIRAHYDGLPQAHRRFLPYYLGRLTDLGHFVAGAPGRYLKAGRDGEPMALEPASMCLGEPLAPAPVVAPEAPPPAPELTADPAGAPPGASSICSPASETGSTVSTPEHVAAAEGGSNCGYETEQSPPLCRSPGPQPDDGACGDASSVHRRPPKKVYNTAPEPVEASPGREDVRPCRGSPPKENVTELDATAEDDCEHGSNPTTPLPVPDNGACSLRIGTPPLPPAPPTDGTVDGMDYVLALPNQGPVMMSGAIKEDPPLSVEVLKVAAGAEGVGASGIGEAKNEVDEPARPSTATSSDPLYGAMIPPPVQNLSEDGGPSAEEAMTEWVVANNSDHLFPFYLEANTEEFVAATRGLYMPPYSDNPGWWTAANGDWLHAMAAATTGTAKLNPSGVPGTSKPSPDAESGSTMSLPEPAAASFNAAAALSVGAFVQPPLMITFSGPESNVVKQQFGGEDPSPVRKRRGRPPKRKINETDLPRDSGREITDNTLPVAPGGGGGPDPSVRRPRGRPRKRPITDGGRSSGDAQNGTGWLIQAPVQVPADGECHAPMRSSEPAESSPAEAGPSEEMTTDNAFLLALLEGSTLELDANVRERLESMLMTPSMEPARSGDGEPPRPPGWGNGLMAASGSFGTGSMMGWGATGGNAAVSQGRGRGRPPKGQGRRGRPRKNQF